MRLLSTRQVHELRERVQAGEARKRLAFEYGISNRSITDVLYGRSYKHVHGSLPEPPLHKRVTSEERAEMRAFIRQGHTVKQAVAHFERSRQTVRNHTADLLKEKQKT